MTVSLRLDDELAQRLDAAAKATGVSKSEYIRECLRSHFNGEVKPPPTAWELGKDLFGCYNSGDGTLSERVEEVVRERIHAKFAEKRRRDRHRTADRSV
jgi:predicted transcriptional regulator